MIVLGHDYPDELHYLVDDQVWARLHDDGSATVGIAAMGIAQAGEVYMCRPKPVGADVAQGRSVAVVELAKSIVSVRSPVTGVVVEVNPRLAREPELVHRAPYGDGWLARLRLADLSADLSALVHGETVGAAMERYARLNRLD